MNSVQDTVRMMSDFVNSINCDYKQFAEEFSCQHCTLQQNFTKLCVAWLKELSETKFYDDRNEASVKFAKSIKQQLDDVILPFI